MFLSKKRYRHTLNTDPNQYDKYNYGKESNLRYTTKNIIALGATTSLAYLAYQHGLAGTVELFNQTLNPTPGISQTIDHNSSAALLYTLGGFGGGLVMGFFAEMIAMSFTSYRNYKSGSTLAKFVIAGPIVAAAYSIHSSPDSMAVLMDSMRHVLEGGATIAVALLSASAFVSPLFFSSIANKVDEMIDSLPNKIPVFKRLTQQCTQYIINKKKEKEDKKAVHALETHDDDKVSDYTDKTLNTHVLAQFGAIRHTINEALSSYSIERNNYTLANEVKHYIEKLVNHSLFILDNITLDTLTGKQEVVSLVSSTLPQLTLSYYRSLNNQDKEAMIENTQKLVDALKTTHEHFDGIVEQIKKSQTSLNNMDFEQALEFTKARFSKKQDETLTQENSKTLKMGS